MHVISNKVIIDAFIVFINSLLPIEKYNTYVAVFFIELYDLEIIY